MYPKARAWIELNMEHLRHNVKEFERIIPNGCKLMPAVKANAYGHGADMLAVELQKAGITDFCVACVSEGIELRNAGIEGEILVLGYTPPWQMSELWEYDLTQTIIDVTYALEIEQIVDQMREAETQKDNNDKKKAIVCKAQVAVDTGMHRLGIWHEEIAAVLSILHSPFMDITGVYSHLCAADGQKESDIHFTKEQIKRFEEVKLQVRHAGYHTMKFHLQSSYGVLNYPELSYDYIRLGIALYGVLSSKHDTYKADVELRPVLSLKSRVQSTRHLSAGESAGYGLAYTATREISLAVVSIGYADGIPRSLSCEKGQVLINGKRYPIAGRVCMDQIIVEVPNEDDISIEDEVVFIGQSGEEAIEVCDIAEWADTISNEILSCLGVRLVRIAEESDNLIPYDNAVNKQESTWLAENC